MYWWWLAVACYGVTAYAAADVWQAANVIEVPRGLFRRGLRREWSNLELRPQAHDDGFEPYRDNGGTVIAIAGSDYCIIAADSRLSSGYTILSRDISRVHEIGQHKATFLVTAGCWSDTQGLLKLLDYLAEEYEWSQGRPLGTLAFARLLATNLYYRRGFPFYTYNVVGGLDDQGNGAVFGYDAIGSFERIKVACAGAGRDLVQSFLDKMDSSEQTDQAGMVNEEQEESEGGKLPVVTAGCEEALSMVKKAFLSASERAIELGDSAELVVVTRHGVTRERLELAGH
ncbi:unnamed protein product [Chrysoparadoxa australica]